MKAITLVAVLISESAVAGTTESQQLVGSWKHEESMLIGGVQLFTTFNSDQTCTQVIKGRALGMTKWAVYRCVWAVDGTALNLTITGAPDQKNAEGKVISFQIVRLGEGKLLLENRGEQQEWTSVAEIPAEFGKRLESGRAPSGQD